ncbi:MAG TPA: SRPBCC family protein [Stellaceae bacterium]|nr:SRPBCC family protein [Stellaceae bacterium]
MSDRFVYVTYIRTTPETLWDHLTKAEFTRLYWQGISAESDWKPGSSWKLRFEDGRVADTGEIVEADPPRRLVIKWRNEFMPELTAEGYSRATFELETVAQMVKLTVTHEIDRTGSKFIQAVSGGWPIVLASLKSLLETGQALPRYKPAK